MGVDIGGRIWMAVGDRVDAVGADGEIVWVAAGTLVGGDVHPSNKLVTTKLAARQSNGRVKVGSSFFNDGLGNVTIHHLAIAATAPQAGLLVAATDSGIWQTPLTLVAGPSAFHLFIPFAVNGARVPSRVGP